MNLFSCYMNRFEYSTSDYHNMTRKLLKVWMFLASNILDHISLNSLRVNLPKSTKLAIIGRGYFLCNFVQYVQAGLGLWCTECYGQAANGGTTQILWIW